MKKVIVLFSGGLDSTYLLWKNLEDGNEVQPVYISIKNNYNKVKVEKQQTKKLYSKFHEKYGDKIKRVENILDFELITTNYSVNLAQIPIWISGILYYQSKRYDEIQIGYVMNDDAVSYIDVFKKIYESYSEILNEKIPIHFPLVKYSKVNIINNLPEEYHELITACENPRILNEKYLEDIEYKPCGYCDACDGIIKSNNFGKGLNNDYYEIKKRDVLADIEKYYGNIIELKNFVENEYNKPITIKPKQLKLEFENENILKREPSTIKETLKSA